MVQVWYILLIDDFSQVCAILMCEQEFGAAGSSLMREKIPQHTHSFCAIHSLYIYHHFVRILWEAGCCLLVFDI
ncbi:Bgt-51528 [Blumeria graminis f. sp. tritici]|uniref:Bgt-51528 n=1 Tax=Blumeria graminis f. sp. tritici TaxID=62690 RepID=A0A9X9QES1_BLUGR|nr:Bgt-51528 [Blumeria graminis f. sp. tritici]